MLTLEQIEKIVEDAEKECISFKTDGDSFNQSMQIIHNLGVKQMGKEVLYRVLLAVTGEEVKNNDANC